MTILKKHSEAAIKKDCWDYLKELQKKNIIFWVGRHQSGKVRVGGYWMYLNPPGTPDFQILKREAYCPRLSTIWIECKSPKGKLSPEQINFRENIQKHSKDSYFLITNIKQLTDYFKIK